MVSTDTRVSAGRGAMSTRPIVGYRHPAQPRSTRELARTRNTKIGSIPPAARTAQTATMTVDHHGLFGSSSKIEVLLGPAKPMGLASSLDSPSGMAAMRTRPLRLLTSREQFKPLITLRLIDDVSD
jgi:hypothetical protein